MTDKDAQEKYLQTFILFEYRCKNSQQTKCYQTAFISSATILGVGVVFSKQK